MAINWGNTSKGAIGGASVGGMGGGIGGGVAANIPGVAKAGRNLDSGFRGMVGMDNSKQKQLAKDAAAARENQYQDTTGILSGMKNQDDDYLKTMQGHANDYRSRLDILQREADDQAKNARTTYSNDIAPRQKSIMEEAGREAGSAMSLADAGDPNNRVHQQVRQLYGNEAEGVRKTGLADAGVLAALGAQATAGQMGGAAPMTGGQLAMLQGQNMAQSGAAYARAQARMNQLKQQGIDRGFDESSAQYERGQRAKDRYSGSIQDYEGGLDRSIGRDSGLRAERGGYDADHYGVASGMAGLGHGLGMGQGQRDLGAIDQRYGNQQATIAQQMSQANADNAARSAMFGGILQGGSTAAGGMMGGYEGAKVGNSIGGSVAGGMQQGGQAPVPQQQQYGYRQPQRYGQYA